MKKLIYVSFSLTFVGLWPTEVSIIIVVRGLDCSPPSPPDLAAVGQETAVSR
jgi:hypothetical protein